MWVRGVPTVCHNSTCSVLGGIGGDDTWCTWGICLGYLQILCNLEVFLGPHMSGAPSACLGSPTTGMSLPFPLEIDTCCELRVVPPRV